MNYYSMGEFAKRISVTVPTMRNWHKQGKFIPNHITEGGHRYYRESQLQRFLGVASGKERVVIGYCRVSSHKQKDDLERQMDHMKVI